MDRKCLCLAAEIISGFLIDSLFPFMNFLSNFSLGIVFELWSINPILSNIFPNQLLYFTL